MARSSSARQGISGKVADQRAALWPGYVLEDQVGHLLRRAHQRATQIFLAKFAASALTPTQFAALVRLDQYGTLSQNHLGRLTAMDPATIQGVIRRLAARRLIARVSDAGDRRRAMLSLSSEGRALLRRLLKTGLSVSAATLKPLGPTERRAFLGMLRRLI
ncbi:MAG: MarR family transcriptional regulator [Alphaproteobacteria bacterium]|nr:MarR family transcriptional regulator [Alphaproteobacteria bacterium]